MDIISGNKLYKTKLIYENMYFSQKWVSSLRGCLLMAKSINISDTFFFFHKNTLYRNIVAENGPKIKNNLRAGSASD